MVNKFFLLTLLTLISCGRDVNISTKSLENNSKLSNGTNAATVSASLHRGATDTITINGSSYKVSIYSSYAALEFIAAKPPGTQMPVFIKGVTKNSEFVLEIIKAQ